MGCLVISTYNKGENDMNMDMNIEMARMKAEFEGFRLKTAMPALSATVMELTRKKSNMMQFFNITAAAVDDDSVEVQIPDDMESPIWILPGLGYVATDYMELLGEVYNIRLFTVQAAKDWLLRYSGKRPDIVEKVADAVARALAEYIDEAAWRTIVPAVTTAFDGAGVLCPRPAQIFELPAGDPAAGYFSKELVNRMIVGAKRIGKRLVTLLVSPEDKADIREWTDVDVDPMTRYEIFHARGLDEIFDVRLVEMDELGVRGIWNIGDKEGEFGPFKGDPTHNSYNDYGITHGNIMDNNGNLVVAGETQIYGLMEDSKEHLHMPMAPFQAFYDPALHRRMKEGFYGWQKFGSACTDARVISMGVIDRYHPDFGICGMSEWLERKEKAKDERKGAEKKAKETEDKINRLTAMVRKDPEKLEALLTLLSK